MKLLHYNPFLLAISDGSSAEAGITRNASQPFSRSEVRIAPTQMAPGGKASLQPKRTPMSNEEIEAILASMALS
ncbi:hypothetical protein RJ641_035676 [Dillenia turbinata]|uniref:Uncharacterized protein n=1 Tax=Dillenia turbinata TaxID=194707 RepID=A0AAN8ZEX7_9MAGN